MIHHTVFAAAKEDNRPILTGIYIEINNGVLTLAAADGYRLAVRTAQLEHAGGKPFSMVVPARALAEVGRIITEDDDEVSITLPGEREVALFTLKNVLVSAQVLAGKFPDFTAIIPRSYSTETVLYTSDLLRACKRAEIFARDSAGSAQFVVKPPRAAGEPGEVVLIGRSNERGDNTGMLDATVEGEPLDISFNVRYMIDVLNVISDEKVVFQSSGPANPGVIRPLDRSDFVHVIMPMSRSG
jgi:DNA polymerase-3 subunit beta